MSNILNHNRNIFDLKLDMTNYWDFHLSLDNYASSLPKKCLSVYIDTDDSNCVWFDTLTSKNDYTWDKSINNGVELHSIGYTGVDNGLIKYEKDRISNSEFLNLFLNSILKIENNDFKLHLTKVDGNNQIFNYDTFITYLGDIQVLKLNGGFYQGFFKTNEDYQVLPIEIENEWKFSFTLYKEDFINNGYTLNHKHPENKGIFFYIGTRSENKWWKHYLTDKNFIQDNEYFISEKNIDNDYLVEQDKEEYEYSIDDYFSKEDEYTSDSPLCCNSYLEDSYIESEIKINTNMKLETSEGYDLYQPNIIEYKTDNKFITYNHTCNGFTTKDNIDNTEVIIYDIKPPKLENYFTLFNHTCDGYTTKNIDKLINEKNKEYDVLNDLYKNALCFQITDDGKLGYKYFVKDCDNNSYKIESEYSKSIIKEKEWLNIDVKIKRFEQDYMQLYFYLNNRLVMISKKLPLLKIRSLNDLYSKQETIPYNISIGGGTQGLCDTVDLNYMTPPNEILPLEKEFGGSFIGYIKVFKFYTC